MYQTNCPTGVTDSLLQEIHLGTDFLVLYFLSLLFPKVLMLWTCNCFQCFTIALSFYFTKSLQRQAYRRAITRTRQKNLPRKSSLWHRSNKALSVYPGCRPSLNGLPTWLNHILKDCSWFLHLCCTLEIAWEGSHIMDRLFICSLNCFYLFDGTTQHIYTIACFCTLTPLSFLNPYPSEQHVDQHKRL